MTNKKNTTPTEEKVYLITAALGVSDKLILIGDREFRAVPFTQREKIERSIMQQKIQRYAVERKKALLESGITEEEFNSALFVDPEGFEHSQKMQVEFLADVLNKRIHDKKEPITADFLLDNYPGDLGELFFFFNSGKSMQQVLGDDPNA